LSGAGCAGTATCTVTVDQARTVTAAFALRPLPASAPKVRGLAPDSGVAGQTVTITGSGFAAASAVLFGDVPATFVVDGAGQITAVAPDGPTGAVDVQVVSPVGTSARTPAGVFTYAAASSASQSTPAPSPIVCRRVPTLTGWSIAQARRILDRDGCRAVKLTRTGRRAKGRARIVAQTPKPGTTLRGGDATVTVRVAARKRPA
jgi:hypothetical protein